MFSSSAAAWARFPRLTVAIVSVFVTAIVVVCVMLNESPLLVCAEFGKQVSAQIKQACSSYFTLEDDQGTSTPALEETDFKRMIDEEASLTDLRTEMTDGMQVRLSVSLPPLCLPSTVRP